MDDGVCGGGGGKNCHCYELHVPAAKVIMRLATATRTLAFHVADDGTRHDAVEDAIAVAKAAEHDDMFMIAVLNPEHMPSLVVGRHRSDARSCLPALALAAALQRNAMRVSVSPNLMGRTSHCGQASLSSDESRWITGVAHILSLLPVEAEVKLSFTMHFDEFSGQSRHRFTMRVVSTPMRYCMQTMRRLASEHTRAPAQLLCELRALVECCFAHCPGSAEEMHLVRLLTALLRLWCVADRAAALGRSLGRLFSDQDACIWFENELADSVAFLGNTASTEIRRLAHSEDNELPFVPHLTDNLGGCTEQQSACALGTSQWLLRLEQRVHASVAGCLHVLLNYLAFVLCTESEGTTECSGDRDARGAAKARQTVHVIPVGEARDLPRHVLAGNAAASFAAKKLFTFLPSTASEPLNRWLRFGETDLSPEEADLGAIPFVTEGLYCALAPPHRSSVAVARPRFMQLATVVTATVSEPFVFTVEEFARRFGSITLLPATSALLDRRHYESPLPPATCARMVLLRASISVDHAQARAMSHENGSRLVYIRSWAELTSLCNQLRNARYTACALIAACIHSSFAWVLRQRRQQHHLMTALGVLQGVCRARLSSNLAVGRFRERFIDERTNVLLRRKQLYHERKRQQQLVCLQGGGEPSEADPGLAGPEILLRRMAKQLLTIERIQREALEEESAHLFKEHFAIPFEEMFPVVGVARAEERARGTLLHLHTRASLLLLEMQEEHHRMAGQLCFGRQWNEIAQLYSESQERIVREQEELLRGSIKDMESAQFAQMQRGALGSTLSSTIDDIYGWIEVLRGHASALQAMNIRTSPQQLNAAPVLDMLDSIEAASLLMAARNHTSSRGSRALPPPAVEGTFHARLKRLHRHLREREALLMSLHMEKQFMLNSEASAFSVTCALFCGTTLSIEHGTGARCIRTDERADRSRLLFSHSTKLLSHLEFVTRFFLCAFNAIQGQELEARRRIGLEELHFRRVITGIGTAERCAIVKDLSRWEQVFNDTYASPSRLIAEWREEQRSVRHLLQAVATAELRVAAKSSGVYAVDDLIPNSSCSNVAVPHVSHQDDRSPRRQGSKLRATTPPIGPRSVAYRPPRASRSPAPAVPSTHQPQYRHMAPTRVGLRTLVASDVAVQLADCRTSRRNELPAAPAEWAVQREKQQKSRWKV